MPVQTSPEDTTTAQWDAIKAILAAETQPGGRLTNCAWTDAVGNVQTSSIVDVRRNIIHFFADQLDPNKYDVRSRGIAGVQLLKWGPEEYASTRYKLVTMFQITVGAVSVTHTIGDSDLIANGDDALAQAWSFVSDGNGNGISSILRDPTNRTLNGTVEIRYLGNGTPRLEVGAGETPQMWAFIDVMLRCEKTLSAFA